MIEKGPSKETNPQRRESILSQGFVEMVLATARENLKKDDALAPVLFLRFKDGAQAIAQLSLPPTTEEKEAYFATLGRVLQQAGQVLDEAVFVSESWYVAAEKCERLELDVAPSQHPKRKEAIGIVITLILGTVGGLWLTGSTLAPLQWMIVTCRRIAGGDLSQRVNLP